MGAFITLDGNKIKIVVGSEKYTTGVTVSPTDDLSRIQEKIKAAIKEATEGPFDKEQLKDINVSRTAKVLQARMGVKERTPKAATPVRTDREANPAPRTTEPSISIPWVRANVANPDEVYKNLERIGKASDDLKDVMMYSALKELYKGNSFKFYLSSEAWSTKDPQLINMVKRMQNSGSETVEREGVMKGMKTYLERYGATINSVYKQELAKVGELDHDDGKILLATALWIRRMKDPSAKEWEKPKQEEKRAEPPTQRRDEPQRRDAQPPTPVQPQRAPPATPPKDKPRIPDTIQF